MPTALEITFQDREPSALVEQCIREHLNELEALAPILVCHVTVRPHHHYWQGDLFALAVEVDLPGERFVVGRERPAQHAHEDLRIAVRNTFAEVKTAVESYVHRRLSADGELADNRFKPGVA